MNIHFYKYQGTGNDFIILDNREGAYGHLSREQVSFLCHRRFGIGADGLMLLNLLEGYDFEMKYYNSDGAESSMCGNGGRCLVQFAKDIGLGKDKYRFLAIDGDHDAYFDDNGWVKLKMKDVQEIITYDNDLVLDTGSPHYIRQVTRVKEFPVTEQGKRIRYNSDFNDKGINVNFVEVAQKGIYVRTYERGVENETLSCGTGVTACALVFAENEKGFNRINVQTPGGSLAVEFEKTGKNKFKNIWLCGPATFVFKGEVRI